MYIIIIIVVVVVLLKRIIKRRVVPEERPQKPQGLLGTGRSGFWGGSMEVEEEGDYIPVDTLSPPE